MVTSFISTFDWNLMRKRINARRPVIFGSEVYRVPRVRILMNVGVDEWSSQKYTLWSYATFMAVSLRKKGRGIPAWFRINSALSNILENKNFHLKISKCIRSTDRIQVILAGNGRMLFKEVRSCIALNSTSSEFTHPLRSDSIFSIRALYNTRPPLFSRK